MHFVCGTMSHAKSLLHWSGDFLSDIVGVVWNCGHGLETSIWLKILFIFGH